MASRSKSGSCVHFFTGWRLYWACFLTIDGEKPWRQRDSEFDNMPLNRDEMMQQLEEGWKCVFNGLGGITDEDLEKIVYVRHEGHTVLEAINRQRAHYSHHVGQIAYVSKLRIGTDWMSLSIPRNKSAEYNNTKFSQDKGPRDFTGDWVNMK